MFYICSVTPATDQTRADAPAPLLCDGGPEKACGCGAGETCAQRNGRRLVRLDAIADMGVDMAKGAHAAHQALPAADTPEGATPEVTDKRETLNQAFARIARIVERVSRLEARLHATGGTLAPIARASAPAASPPTSPPKSPPKSPEDARAETVERRKTSVGIWVETAILDEADPDEADDLIEALEQLLNDPRHADALADLPDEVVKARLCHDLDLPRDWAIWDEECCEREVARLDQAKAPP
jgi:hypothetical protein